MTREETVKIIRIMVDSYPNYKPNNLSETVDVWNMMLEECSYQQVSMALKEYILTEKAGFAPSIGQIANMIKEQAERKYFEGLEKMLLETSYKAQIEDKRLEAIKSLNERKESEIRALGDKREGVPMPKRCKQRMEELRNEIISRNNS